ncbi:MAG: hypothetical protein RJB62_699 [Pseudomonadota bacterium]
MGFVNGLIPGLSFGAPLVLIALLGLPVIYWLLRVTPPAPKRVVFPPLRLLFGMISPEETPSRTPLWLLLLRLATAAVAILALAEPVYDSTPAANGDGPLVLVVDNDWAAAQHWQERLNAMQNVLNAAQTAEQPVTIISTAETMPLSPQWMDAGQAAGTADEIIPEPWLANRTQALAALDMLEDAPSAPQIVWLSNGIDDEGARAFADALAGLGDLTIYSDDVSTAPLALRPPESAANGFAVTVLRGDTGGVRAGQVAALDGRGLVLETAPFQFGAGDAEASATIELPLELRNDTTRIIVQGAESAGSVQLMDSRYLRRPVGVVAGAGSNASVEQPLVSDLFYIERALQTYAEIRKGTLDQVIDSGIAVLVLADIGQLSDAERERVTAFVEAGGMLLRFAGPRIAALPPDDSLMPVRLRGGERLMGSALAWAEPQQLAPFPEESPFLGLPVPAEVTVSRQVLAEPSIELAEQTWARLQDGTPLVTAAQRGQGQIVLFHVPASPGWSSLPLSGLYVEMLRRTVNLSGGVRGQAAQTAVTVPPYQTLDGFGRLVRPFPEAIAIDTTLMATLAPSAQNPPGLYGNQGGVVAFNAINETTELAPLDVAYAQFGYATGGILSLLKWPLLQLVLIVLIADALISLFLRGYIPSPRATNRETATTRAAAMILALALVTSFSEARAEGLPDPREAMNMSSALDTKLAYVITGAADVDQMSQAGLFGLSLQVHARTAYEPVAPVGIDLERDDLSFYPLLYWPMTPAQPDLSSEALTKVDAFMRNGGTILFDTRDQPLSGLAAGVASPGETTLRRLLEKLDIPPLQPVPPEHVLTKSFYLLSEFPGRWVGGQVWIEALPEQRPGEDAPIRGGDGVSPIIIGGNDWAAAWALDEEAMPIAAVVPGGEQQREMAVRFGVNVVIYALTGNYKTDQVHVQTLLDRLGQ